MTTSNSTYAKPFLTIPEQIRRLRERGMDCGENAYAADVLERYGYYRLSGYWHLYRDRPAPPAPPAPLFDEDDREIRPDTFVPGTGLAHVVSLYEFDHELRMRFSDALSMIETAFRFFVGHRLGRVDAFAHRHPWALGATRQEDPSVPPEPTTAYHEWLEEYDRHEKRARGDFVVHFRQQYGPHLPIWVATEVMSFGVPSSLYDLMRQSDRRSSPRGSRSAPPTATGTAEPSGTGSTTSGTCGTSARTTAACGTERSTCSSTRRGRRAGTRTTSSRRTWTAGRTTGYTACCSSCATSY